MNSGFLLIDKPAGITSHDVVDAVRRVTGERRVGHSGTLDPFATGLLIVGVGRESTKRLGELMKQRKEYIGTATFGAVSDTYDRDGAIVPVESAKRPTSEEVAEMVKPFRGTISQVPPLYSAKWINGKRLHDLARVGKEVTVKPSVVEVYEFEIENYVWPNLGFRVACSSGTYIRSLAHDLGKSLGCGAYLDGLRRTRIGDYCVDDSIKISDLTSENWHSRLFQRS